MAQYQLTYPQSLLELNKFNNGLFPSKYPMFKVYQANKSTTPTSVGTNKQLNVLIYIQILGIVQDLTFTINNIVYSNSNIINGRNLFLKSNDLTAVSQSISNMFLLNGITEDYNYTLISTQTIGSNKTISFSLTAKNSGNNIDLTIGTPTQISFTETITNTSINYTIFNSNAATQITLSLNNIIVGNNISEDVNNYEIGVDIYKLTTNANYLNGSTTNQDKKLINSIYKKGFGLVDFDLSEIINNDILDFVPSIGNFNLSVPKYIEYYQIEAWQKYVDTQIDPLNTFSNISYGNNIDNFYGIQIEFPFLQNYDNTQYNIYAPNAQRNLDYENNGTNGNIYLTNLTNQPNPKQLNQGYEILYNQILLDKIPYHSNLLDKIYMKFYYSGTNGFEIIQLDSTQQLQIGSLRYINQFSFYTPNLKNLIVGDFNLVYKIDVNFFNPNYKGNVSATYPTQTYYIDSTQLSCTDTSDTDINYTPIIFKNRMGAFDSYEFNIIQSLKTTITTSTINTPYNYLSNEFSEFNKIYNIDYNKIYTTKTNILTEDVFNWLEDLNKSDKVYIAVNDKLYPIIIISNDYGQVINTDNIITITFQYSRPQ